MVGSTVTAGLSLGEYVSLVFAGALTFEDGLRLVKIRGECMQKASGVAKTGMVSILGAEDDGVEKLVRDLNAKAKHGEKIQVVCTMLTHTHATTVVLLLLLLPTPPLTFTISSVCCVFFF
jgi:malonyl CoA-acyl carrier protein transacylase